VCVGDVRSPNRRKRCNGPDHPNGAKMLNGGPPYEAIWALEDLTAALLLHVRRAVAHAVMRSSRLQFVRHIRRASIHAVKKLYLDGAFDIPVLR